MRRPFPFRLSLMLATGAGDYRGGAPQQSLLVRSPIYCPKRRSGRIMAVLTLTTLSDRLKEKAQTHD